MCFQCAANLDKNLKMCLYSQTVEQRSLKLCTMLTSIELYIFITSFDDCALNQIYLLIYQF